MITVSVFGWVPEFVRGLVRDLRVRWALEEAGLSYDEHVLKDGERETPEYLALQPFGQVPAYRDDEVSLFESAGIVHHIAQKSPVLMPNDPALAAQVTSWMFAAMNSVEPPIQNLTSIDLFFANEEWAKARRAGAADQVRARLKALAAYLDGKDYLVGGSFTAADLLMSSVLLLLRHTDMLDEYPVLVAYKARCHARPGYEKALNDQLATFDRVAAAQ